MAGSYDPAFHQSGSSTPVTPSGANPYKANVNRQKTRKWVEAKKIDYGGDDWGGDYDDEPEYEPDAPETLDTQTPAVPPPASDVGQQHSIPTGPRSLPTSVLGASRSREASPVVPPGSASRTPLGGPRLHIQTQQNPPANQQTATDTGSPWASNDPHARRGTPIFEIPVFDRGVAAPRIQVAGQNAGPVAPRFPHRKSSLSQADAADAPFATPLGGPTPFRDLDGPPLGITMGSSPVSGQESTQATATAPSKPWTSGAASDRTRSSSPGASSARSPIGQGKPLPFVRPADIYKNLVEEKEKTRRSTESGRPSMDSVRRGTDAVASSTKANTVVPAPIPSQQQAPPQGTAEKEAKETQEDKAQKQAMGEEVPKEISTSSGKQGTPSTGPSKPEEVRLRPVRSGSSTSLGFRENTSVDKPPTRPSTGTSRPTLAASSDKKSDIEGLIASYERRGGTPTTPTFGLVGPYALPGSPAQTPASPDIAPAVPEKDSKFKRPIQSSSHEATHDGRSAADESAHWTDKAGRQGDTVQQGQERPEDELRRLQEELRRLSTSPKLPELTRISLFGQEFFSSPSSSSDARKDSFVAENSLPSPAPLFYPPVAESSFSPAINSSHSVGVVEAGQDQSHREPGATLALESTRTSGLRGTDDVRSEDPDDANLDRHHQDTAGDATLSHPNTGSDARPNGSSGADAEPLRQDPTQPYQGQEIDEENFPTVHSDFDEPSKSEHQSSGVATAGPDSAELVVSETSLVTSDPQASQLVISSPVPISAGSAAELAPPAYLDDPTGKLAVPAALQEAKKSYHATRQVSAEDTKAAEQVDQTPSTHSPATQSSAEASVSEPTSGGGQAPPRARTSQGDVQDEQNVESASATIYSERSTSGTSSQLGDKADLQAVTPPKEKIAEESFHDGVSQDTVLPVLPTVAPTLPVAEQSARGSFVTARMATSPSPGADDESGASKDADALSAEILRSIGHTGLLKTPEQTPDVGDVDGENNKRMSVNPAGARESQFLPDLYDDYWSFAGTGSDQEQNMPTMPKDTPSAMPDALKTRVEEARLEPAAGVKDESGHNIPQSFSGGMKSQALEDNPWAGPGNAGTTRHALTTKFSWERDNAQAPPPPAEPKSLADQQQHGSPPAELVRADIPELPSPPAQPDAEGVSPRVGDENDARRDAAGAQSGDEIVNHIRNSMLYLGHSEHADGDIVGDTTGSAEQRRPSMGLRSPSSIEGGPSDSPGLGTPVTSSGAWTAPMQAASPEGFGFKGPLDSHPVLTFKEIMEKSSPTERIEHFNKARQYYATAPSGLEAIVEHLASLHPDIVVQTGRGLGAGSQPYAHQLTRTTTQEPFGAQSSTAPSAIARPHVPRDVQAAASQVGNKTKEFLHGAGKASKGFFSGLKSKTKKDSSEKPLPKLPPHPTEHIYEHLGRIKPKRLHSWAGSVSTQNSLFNFKDNKVSRRTSFIVFSSAASPASENALEVPNGKLKRKGDVQQLQTGETETERLRPYLARRFSLEGLIESLAGPPRTRGSRLSRGRFGVGSASQRPTISGSNSSIHPAAVSSTSQPPEIPRPTTVSPFDFTSSAYPFALPPTPPPPPPPSKALVDNGDGRDEESSLLIVSTLSETSADSLRPPEPVGKDKSERSNPDNRSPSLHLDAVDRLRIPLPITKYPPTWDLYTASPLVEEDGFSFGTTSQRQSQAYLESQRNTPDTVGNQSDGATENRNAVDSIISQSSIGPEDKRSDSPSGNDWVVVETGATTGAGEPRSISGRPIPQEEGSEEYEEAVPTAGARGPTMAAYTQQQRQLGNQSYPSEQAVANDHSSQMSSAPVASQTGQPTYQAPRPQSQQAWEQSQDFEYQHQHQPPPQQQQGWQPTSSPLPQQQYYQGQQSQQQQNDLSSPYRLPSFVGLPPIRRTSTLMSSVVNVGRENNDDASSVSSLQRAVQGQVVAQPQQADRSQVGTPMQMQMQRPMQPIQEQFIPGAYRPMLGGGQISQGQLSFQNNVAYQQNLQGALHASPQAQHGFQQTPIGTPGARSFSSPAAPSQGMTTIQAGETRFQGHGQPQGSAQLPGMRPQQPASVMPNAGEQIRLPPNGAFQLVESHLQQPLLSPNRNRSSSNTPVPSPQQQQQPYFGYDKETGVPASPPVSRGPEGGQQPYVNGQGSQTGQMRPRANTDLTEESALSDIEPPNAIPASVTHDKSKRNSGIFSVIRDRLSKDAGGEGRRESAAVSESSVATEEIDNTHKRRSFSGLLSGSHLTQSPQQNVNGTSPRLDDRARYVASQGQPSPHNPRMQQERPRSSIAGQSPAAEHQRTFLSTGNGDGSQAALSQQDASRPDMPRQSSSVYSTQSANQPSATPESKQPRKRFSNLKELLRRSGSSEEQGQGHEPPGSSHSGAPSLNSIPQGRPASWVMNTPQQSQAQAFARPAGGQGQPSFQGGHLMRAQQGQPGQQQPVQEQHSGQQGQVGQVGQPLRHQPQQLVRDLQPGEQPQSQQGPPIRQPQQTPPGQGAQQTQQTQQTQQLQQLGPGYERRPSQQSPAQTQQSNGKTTPQDQQYTFVSAAQRQPQQQLQPTPQQNLQHRFSMEAQSQQRQLQPQQEQLAMMAPPPPIGAGRQRSGSTGSGRLFTAGGLTRPPVDEERGRKPSSSGSGFLSSIFSGRSGSKPREPEKEDTPPQSQPQDRMAPQTGPLPSQYQQQAAPFAQIPGQQLSPGAQYRIAVPQQTGLRQPGQTANGQSPNGQFGQQQMGQAQSRPPGLSNQSQQGSGQINGQLTGQPLPPNRRQLSGIVEQGSRPVITQQQPTQQSQSLPGKTSQDHEQGQHQGGLMNGQRLPQQGHLYPQAGSHGQDHHQQQQQQQLTQAPPEKQKPLGPLNQHPVATAPGPLSQGFSGSSQAPNHMASQQSLTIANRGPSNSSQLGSPVSQLSQGVPYTPVEPRRSESDTPPAFGQPPQQQQTGQSLTPTSPSPPPEAISRKPVPPSPRPSEPSVDASDQGAQSKQEQHSVDVSAVNSVQSSPVQYSRKPFTPQLMSEATSPYVPQQQQPMNPLRPLQGTPQAPSSAETGHLRRAGPSQQIEGQGFPPGQPQGALPGQMPRYQVDIRPGGPQPLPSGVPTSAQQNQHIHDRQAPWMQGHPGSSGPPPSRQGQGQAGTAYFQANQPSNGSSKEHQGTISKLLKGITSSSSQDKPDKGKGSRTSLFGFRKHKQSKSDLKILHPQPAQGSPQLQQGPPAGRMVQLSPSQDRLRQLQAQVAGLESQSASGTSPSPGPHTQYQHQRQTPPTGTSPNQTLPAAHGGPPRMVSPQEIYLQQQAQIGAVAQQGGQFQRGQSLPLNQAGPNHVQPQQEREPTLVRQPQMSAHPKPNEPQYAQVPIPGGYGFVRAEGRMEAPSPVAYPVAYYIGPNGQYLPVQTGPQGPQHQGQPWMQPGMATGNPQQSIQHQGQSVLSSPSQQSMTNPPAPVVPANTPSLQQPSVGTMAQQQHLQQQEQSTSPAPNRMPVQHVLAIPSPEGLTPRASPNPGALSPLSDMQSPMLGNPLHNNQLADGNPMLPPVQHQASTQTYSLPNSALSPVHPAAAEELNLPLPNSDVAGVVPAPLKLSEHLHVPSRQPSAVSQLSTPHPGGPAPASSGESMINSREHLQTDSPSRSPSLQATPERMVSPEPVVRSPPPEKNISVEKANQHHVEHDNYYDATPRTSSAHVEHPLDAAATEESEAKAASPDHEEPVREGQAVQNHVLETARPTTAAQPAAGVTQHPDPMQVVTPEPAVAEPAPVHPPITSDSILTSEEAVAPNSAPSNFLHVNATTATTTGIIPPKPIDVYEEARRKAMLRDMEEKIPVFPTEPDIEGQARAEAEAKKKREDRPQMSATSYPGQEWNPYGGGFEEWE